MSPQSDIDVQLQGISSQLSGEQKEKLHSLFADLHCRHKTFLMYYLSSQKLIESYFQAGYGKKKGGEKISNNSAAASARSILKAPKVQRFMEYYEALRQKIALEQTTKTLLAQCEVDPHVIYRELMSIATSDIKNYLEINPETQRIRIKGLEDLPDGASRAIKSVTQTVRGKEVQTTLDLHPKLQAIQMLGKQTGIFNDLNQMLLTARNYGYNVVEVEGAYILLDTYKTVEVVETEEGHLIRNVKDSDEKDNQIPVEPLNIVSIDE